MELQIFFFLTSIIAVVKLMKFRVFEEILTHPPKALDEKFSLTL